MIKREKFEIIEIYQEILVSKRHLLFGRKAMTNLDSVLKSRGIALLTKVRLVKAMIFPEVMYRCESWTIKKALKSTEELILLNCGAGEDS